MIKGWSLVCAIYNEPFKNFFGTEAIHVHQTSPEALEGEAVVKETIRIFTQDGVMAQKLEKEGYIMVPAALIGKRVRWIIETIEEGE